MSTPFSGGCRCGAVRYECSAEPVLTAYCHCRDCQYAAGGPFSTVLGVPARALSIKGETKGYQVTADSGNTVTRRFCPECGSPLFSELSASPGLMIIKVGSLDDPSWAKPTMNIWTDSAQPWCELSDELPRHGKQPQG